MQAEVIATSYKLTGSVGDNGVFHTAGEKLNCKLSRVETLHASAI